MRIFYLSMCCICYAISGIGQSQFTNVFDSLGIQHIYTDGLYAGGSSFHDINRDGIDDITLCGSYGGTQCYLNLPEGLEPLDLSFLTGQIKSIIWVDYDNDGDSDLSVTRFSGTFDIYENTGDLTFTPASILTQNNFYARNSGISWGDYNNDGFLDAYICRYPFSLDDNSSGNTNILLKNLGNGSFMDVTEIAGVSGGYKASFMATWIDLNEDGLQDIYVINDRSEYENLLFINNGNGTFTESSEDYGLDIAIDCMSNSFADYDQDGDFDFYGTNISTGNVLLTNSNSIYENVENHGAEIHKVCWGANWIDYDNDTWLDLAVTMDNFGVNSEIVMFRNNEGVSFTETNLIPDTCGGSFSCAKGDFNQDGLYDLLVLFEDDANSQLLENNTSEPGKWVKIQLKGTESNKDAVGSKIKYFLASESFVTYSFCGSDYLSQDSQNFILGINDHDQIDSLEITWPLGTVEKFYNLQKYQDYLITEGASTDTSIQYSDSLHFCEGDSILLEINNLVLNPIWSDGRIGNEIWVNQSGSYYCQFENDGILISTDTLEICVEELPEIIPLEVQNISCYGQNDGMISLEVIQNGFTEHLFLDSLEADTYNIFFENALGCISSFQSTITEPMSLASYAVTEDVACYGEYTGAVDLDIYGGTSPYEIEIVNNESWGLPAGEYEYIITDALNCVSQGNFEITQPAEPVIDLITNHAVENQLGSIHIYHNFENEISVFFNGEESQTVIEELTPGSYEIQIITSLGCTYDFSISIDLVDNIPESQTQLNFFPNPASETLILRGLHPEHRIQLINNIGQVVYSSTDKVNSEEKLDLTSYHNGIYFLQVSKNGFPELSQQIIKVFE